MLKEARDFICICCPRGCHLHVDVDLKVTGNFCPRGAKYGIQEATNPERTLTSTVRILHASLPLCPVKSASPLPKGLLFEAMKEIDEVTVEAPVHVGQVLLPSLAGTGVALVATSTMERVDEDPSL